VVGSWIRFISFVRMLAEVVNSTNCNLSLFKLDVPHGVAENVLISGLQLFFSYP